MKRFFQGLAIMAICATINFGFDKVEAAENIDADLTASFSEDLNIGAENTESKSVRVIFGPPPPRHHPPGPPHHRYDPPPGHRPFHPPPPPHRRYDPPRHHHPPGPPPRR